MNNLIEMRKLSQLGFLRKLTTYLLAGTGIPILSQRGS